MEIFLGLFALSNFIAFPFVVGFVFIVCYPFIKIPIQRRIFWHDVKKALPDVVEVIGPASAEYEMPKWFTEKWKWGFPFTYNVKDILPD